MSLQISESLRLNYIDFLTESSKKNTIYAPFIVLKELAITSGFILDEEMLRNDVKYKISLAINLLEENEDVKSVSLNVQDSDLIHISRFVNPHEAWKKKLLLESFNWILKLLKIVKFENNEDPFTVFKLLSNSNTIGLPISSNLYSIPSVVIWNNLDESVQKTLDFNISEIQLLKSLLMMKLPVKMLEDVIIDKIVPNSLSMLISVLGIDIDVSKKVEVKYDEKILPSLIKFPRNNIESIAKACYDYNIDLTRSSFPLIDFYRIEVNKTKLSFISIDPEFNKLLQIDPYFYKLKYRFNFNIPYNWYKPSFLMSLCFEFDIVTPSRNEQFYKKSDIINIYSELCTRISEGTFYIGKTLYNKNEESPIDLQEIELLHNDEIISFGILQNECKSCTWKELENTFRESKVPINIFEKTGQFFSNKNILHLYKLSKIKKKSELLLIIEDFTKQLNNFNFKCKLLRFFMDSNSNNKILVIKCIDKLLEIAMMMRGWISGPYIIGDPGAPIEGDEQHFRISLEIPKFYQLCYELKFQSNVDLLDFQLFKWDDKKKEFCLLEGATTVRYRLGLIATGNKSQVEACIRSNSNLFATTYYKICLNCEIKTQFDITELHYVF